MSSILTNNSAMVALQTLKGINSNLMKTQEEISTGKSVGSAKDNAAVWAISKVMEADVKGFKGISDSLSLGSSSVAVARQASETVTSLLTDIKGKIVAAQESNVDRAKIQTDIAAMRDQISSVVNAAQFNGLNLIKGTEAVDVLSSLDRSSDGSVTASSISVARQDLTTEAGVFGGGNDLSANAVSSNTATNVVTSTANTAEITLGSIVATPAKTARSPIRVLNRATALLNFWAASMPTPLTWAGCAEFDAVSNAGIICAVISCTPASALCMAAVKPDASVVAARKPSIRFRLASIAISGRKSPRTAAAGSDTCPDVISDDMRWTKVFRARFCLRRENVCAMSPSES
jgi:hypothetical protein